LCWMDGWRFDVANELNRGRAVFVLCVDTKGEHRLNEEIYV
jgi:hypothetical protein